MSVNLCQPAGLLAQMLTLHFIGTLVAQIDYTCSDYTQEMQLSPFLSWRSRNINLDWRDGAGVATLK